MLSYSITCNEDKLLITEHGKTWSKGCVINLQDLTTEQIHYIINTLNEYLNNSNL